MQTPRPPALLLAAFALLALAWNLGTPVFEAPDESTHFFVAQHIARTGRLPVQTLHVEARGPWEQQGSQPPLYYVLVAPLLRLSGVATEGKHGVVVDGDWAEARINPQNSMGHPEVVGNDNRFVHVAEAWPWPPHVWAVRGARLFSTLLGVLAVAATWALASRVFGVAGGLWLTGASDRLWLAFATTALFAFNPQMLAAFSALSNDPAIIALAAVALWLLLRLWDGRDDGPTIAALAIVVGLAPLAKVSGLALVAFASATVAWLALWGRGPDRDRGRGLAWGLRVGGAIVGATLLLSGWWYLRNLQLYGSLTGLNYMLPEGVGRELNLERWLRGLPAELLGIWRSSWGLFGWFTLPLPAWTYALIDGATAAAGAGLAWAGWRGGAGERLAIDRGAALEAGGPAPDLAVPAAGATIRPPWPRLLWLGLWWGLMFAALLRWLLMVKGGHGRLLFPAWGAVALALVIGWRALLPRAVSDRALAVMVTAGMLELSLGALLGVIRPAFAAPPTITEAEIPATATRVDAFFGGGLRLLAVEHPERVVEGELLPVTLYWRVEGNVRRPGLVALRLDQIVAAAGEAPNGGWSASATGHRAEILSRPSETYLAYPGAGMTPFTGLPTSTVVVDRHRVPVPELRAALAPSDTPDAEEVVLLGQEDRAGQGHRADLSTVGPPADPGAAPTDPARRFAMPVEARLSIHVYDREAGEAWPLTGADAAVGAAGTAAPSTDVERRVVLEPHRRRARGERLTNTVLPVAAFGDPALLRLGLQLVTTLVPTESQEALSVSLPGFMLGEARRPSSGLVKHVVPDPRGLAITWTAARVVWVVERPPERDLAAFVHLVALPETSKDGGPLAGSAPVFGPPVLTFDGEPATHGAYPSSRWREGDVLVADLGWSVPEGARPGDRFILLVGLYERVEGAPRLPAIDAEGERWPNDAVPLVSVVVGDEGGREVEGRR